MKKGLSMVVCLLAVLFVVNITYADLNLIGQGTSVHGTYNLIYDTDLDITWYDYTKTNGSWYTAMDWVGALSVTFGSNTYTDWRLPITFTQNCYGDNCTNSEMGHLFYTELGNTGQVDTSGNQTACYGTENCLTKKGDFQNLQPDTYWSGTEVSASRVIVFHTYQGAQDPMGGNKDNTYNYALAVRPGLAVAPEPISSVLFITGGTLLAGRRLFKKKKA